MTRLLVVIVVALLAVAVYAMTAPAGPQAVSPARVAKLEKKVNSLQSQLNCLKTGIGMTQYGDGQTGTAGYVYQNPDKTLVVTTGLDVTGQGDRTSFVVATIKSSCLSSRAGFGKVERRAPKALKR